MGYVIRMKQCIDPKPMKKKKIGTKKLKVAVESGQNSRDTIKEAALNQNQDQYSEESANDSDNELIVDRQEYFKALLQGITKTEKKGYDVLVELGTCRVKRIFTAGGGAKNKKMA